MDGTPKQPNLGKELKEQLPTDLFTFIRRAGEMAQERQQRLYLVGGVVRDILFERCTLDIDLSVEGDAVKLAQEMLKAMQGKITVHEHFGTAKIQWRNRTADFISARAETYARPGALPDVRPGTIADDLARRDFSVNTMAIEVNPAHFGEVIDPYDGRGDIQRCLIRVLHDKSFIDDATRIWRAVRYEQRLDFEIEPKTLALLTRDTSRMASISGDRIRNELELVLQEELPEKVLRRAGELGLLAAIHPALKWDERLDDIFFRAGAQCQPDKPQPQLLLALLLYRLSAVEMEAVIAFLHLPRAFSQILRDTTTVKGKMLELAAPGLAPSRIYELLHRYSLTALAANVLATEAMTAAENIELYVSVLRHVNPVLTGEDMARLGVKAGPQVKELLQRLRKARLDGLIETKREEEEMVRGMVSPPS